MKGKIRNLFPGGNTPEGFYSYYRYILGQKEATALICLKGGPGTGKSRFMKAIGKAFVNKGEDVDFFRCSSDPDSVDGVLLRRRKIAVVDGTSPHITDPLNPGAVDCIINLGEYWNGSHLKKNKSYIIESNEKTGNYFSNAYNYLKSAAALRQTAECIYHQALRPGELYNVAASIIERELSGYRISLNEGCRKKYFASAITCRGVVSYMDRLTEGCTRLYGFDSPEGLEAERILKIISENVVHRGFLVEEFYCPMKPASRLEHLLVPELGLGFVTLNSFHDMDTFGHIDDLHLTDLRNYIDWNRIESYREELNTSIEKSREMISYAVASLGKAKEEHDLLEKYYTPAMDFEKIEALQSEIIGKIDRKVL